MATVDGVGAFTIREVTGDRRTIRLTGRALPYRPFSLEGSQRNEKSMISGNPEAVIQVFGSEEKDTTIKGFWKDIFIGDTIARFATVNGQWRSSAKDLMEELDDVRQKGQEVEVTWLHEQRRGLLANVKKEWHNLHDCEWEMTFVWSAQSKDVPTAAQRAAVSVQRAVADFASQVASQFQDVQQKAVAVTPQQALGRVGLAVKNITTALNSITQVVTDVADTVDKVATAAVDPVWAAQRSAAAYEGSVQDSYDLIKAAYSRVERSAYGDVARDIGQAVSASQANRDTVRSARDTRAKAARARDALLKSANPDLLSAFVARDDQDLRAVSLRFYGTQDGWRSLMQFNRLDSSRLVAGQVIFVPQRRREVTT